MRRGGRKPVAMQVTLAGGRVRRRSLYARPSVYWTLCKTPLLRPLQIFGRVRQRGAWYLSKPEEWSPAMPFSSNALRGGFSNRGVAGMEQHQVIQRTLSPSAGLLNNITRLYTAGCW